MCTKTNISQSVLHFWQTIGLQRNSGHTMHNIYILISFVDVNHIKRAARLVSCRLAKRDATGLILEGLKN